LGGQYVELVNVCVEVGATDVEASHDQATGGSNLKEKLDGSHIFAVGAWVSPCTMLPDCLPPATSLHFTTGHSCRKVALLLEG
jgi:hypothetical protein